MKHWMEYVKASYDLIMEAESRSNVLLDHEVEAWTVHTFARYMERPHIPTDAIAIKMMTTVAETGAIRKQHLQEIAEECILIDGLRLNSRRWPSPNYYRDMGRLACEHRAWTDRPPELFYERVAHYYDDISRVLQGIRA